MKGLPWGDLPNLPPGTLIQMPDPDDRLRNRAQAIHERLIQVYGHRKWRPHLDPISEVVSTILSQNTSDGNRDMAFDRLRTRCATWEMVRDAPVEAIEAAIRPAGLAPQKAPRIKQALLFAVFLEREMGVLSVYFDLCPA